MRYLLSLIGLLMCNLCHGRSYDIVTVFGGSYADNGMGYLISTGGPPLSPIPPTPPYFEGKFSNGPIYVDYLPQLLDVPYPIMSVAVGGSTTFTANAEDVTGARGLGGVMTQISRYETTFTRIPSGGLTILQVGADNIIYLNEIGQLTNPQEVEAAILQAVSDLKTDVAGIRNLGAEQVVLFNIPNPALIPVFTEDPAVLPVVEFIVDAIDAAIVEFPRVNNNALFVYDFRNVVEDVLTQFVKAGGNITEHTLSIVSIDPYIVIENGPSPANLAYWDGLHFTTNIQPLLAQYFASVINAPRTIGAQMDLAFISGRNHYNTIETRLCNLTRRHQACDCTGLSLVVDGGGNFGNRCSQSRDFGFSYKGYDINLGLDYQWTPSLTTGLMSSFLSSAAPLHRQRGHLLLNDWVLAAYGLYFKHNWSLDGEAAFHYYDYRHIDRTHLIYDRTARTKTQGYGPEIALKGSYYLPMHRCWDLVPFLGADYRTILLDGYKEHGAVFADLTMPRQTEHSLLGKLGCRAFTTGYGGFYGDALVGYEHEFLRFSHIAPLFFGIDNNHLHYRRNRQDRDFIRAALRAGYTWCGTDLTLSYVGLYGMHGGSLTSHSVQLTLNRIWF